MPSFKTFAWFVWLYVEINRQTVSGVTHYYVVECGPGAGFFGASVVATGSSQIKTCADIIATPPVLTAASGFITLEPVDDIYRPFKKHCCGRQGTSQCPGCYEKVTRCVLRIYNEDDKMNVIIGQPNYEAYCVACPQKDCEMTCDNGNYAADYMIRSPTSRLVETFTTCRECDPGTFLTCVDKEQCTW